MAGWKGTRRDVLAGVGVALAGAGATAVDAADGSTVPGDLDDLDRTEHALVEFREQTATGTVSVERARLPDGGFVTIRDGSPTGPVVGVSKHLVAEILLFDVQIDLEEPLADATDLFAVLHRDTDGDREFDFRGTDGAEDGPYLNGGTPVADGATVSPPSTPTPEPTPTPTATPTPGGGAGQDGGNGTRGLSTPILGLGAAALFAGGAVAGVVGWQRFVDDGSAGGRADVASGDRAEAADAAPAEPDDPGRTGAAAGGADATAERDLDGPNGEAAGAEGAGRDGPTPWALKRDRGEASERRVGGGHGPPRQVPGPPDLAVAYDDLRITELLRRDDRADVYRATAGSEEVVVREPRFEGSRPESAEEQFAREAEAWAELSAHDNVVGLVGWGTEPTPWLAMEPMDAGDLADRGEGLPLIQATWIAASVADAVAYAHERDVRHLDLRPSNVLFRWAGEDAWAVPKVSDWGAGRTLLDHSRAVGGPSPRYAAPEQVDPQRYGSPGRTTDVYQVGAICYELFTGRPPFAGEVSDVLFGVLEDDPAPPTSLAGGLPYELDEILLGAMAKHPRNRYESLAYLRDDLWDLYDSIRGRR